MNHEKNGKRSIEATSYEPAGRLLLEISFDGTDYRVASPLQADGTGISLILLEQAV